jgi:hypothetical protein
MATDTGNTQSAKAVVGHLETFHGAEHRDRRRDQPVAVQQGGAEHPEGDGGGGDPSQTLAAPRSRALLLPRDEQGGEGENAALTVIVGAHHEGQVLDRDDDHERPEHDRGDAVGARRVDVEIVVLERLAHGVQRARADVAVDDPESPDGKAEHTSVAGVPSVVSVVEGGVAHECESLGGEPAEQAPVHAACERAHNGRESRRGYGHARQHR